MGFEVKTFRFKDTLPHQSADYAEASVSSCERDCGCQSSDDKLTKMTWINVFCKLWSYFKHLTASELREQKPVAMEFHDMPVTAPGPPQFLLLKTLNPAKKKKNLPKKLRPIQVPRTVQGLGLHPRLCSKGPL